MITGGAGFIGGHITEYILKQGHEVVVFDNLSTGNINNLDKVKDIVTFIKGDICDKETVFAAAKGIDHIIHHAAEISTIKSINEPDFTNKVNVEGTINLLMAARENNVKRFVLASSSAIYGDTGLQPQKEDFLPKPLSPYGASKIAGEYYLNCFYQLFGLETVSLRYFNVFGPRQNPKSQYAAVIPKFIDQILKGQEIHVYGDGEQTRDFVYVENIAMANYLACTAEGAAGKVFNIACQNTITVNKLADDLSKLACKDVEVIHDDQIVGEIKYSASDISLAREILKYEPIVSFEEGLKRTFNYFSDLANQNCQH